MDAVAWTQRSCARSKKSTMINNSLTGEQKTGSVIRHIQYKCSTKLHWALGTDPCLCTRVLRLKLEHFLKLWASENHSFHYYHLKLCLLLLQVLLFSKWWLTQYYQYKSLSLHTSPFLNCWNFYFMLKISIILAWKEFPLLAI